MPASTIGLNLKGGFPGTVSALPDDIVRTFQVKADTSVKVGQPVELHNVSGANPQIKPAAEHTLGIVLRGVRTPTGLSYTQFGAEIPAGEFVDVLLRGNCSVKIDSGTPVAGAVVNFDTATGNFTAAAVVDEGTVVASENIVFASAVKDTDGMVEVTVKTRAI